MFVEDYDNFSDNQKKQFADICNKLYRETFVVLHDYEKGDRNHRNPDYTFLSANEDTFRDYLAYAGWNLTKGDDCFYIDNSNHVNLHVFNNDHTKYLLAIASLYQEDIKDVNITNAVVVKVSDVLAKLGEFGILDKKKSVNMKGVKSILRVIDSYNIIKRINGNCDSPDCDFVILPTVLSVLSKERVAAMVEEMKSEDGELGEGELNEET